MLDLIPGLYFTSSGVAGDVRCSHCMRENENVVFMMYADAAASVYQFNVCKDSQTVLRLQVGIDFPVAGIQRYNQEHTGRFVGAHWRKIGQR